VWDPQFQIEACRLVNRDQLSGTGRYFRKFGAGADTVPEDPVLASDSLVLKAIDAMSGSFDAETDAGKQPDELVGRRVIANSDGKAGFVSQYKPRKTKFVVKYYVVVPVAGARAAAQGSKSRASKVVEMTRTELNLVLDYEFEAEPAAHDGGEEGAAAAGAAAAGAAAVLDDDDEEEEDPEDFFDFSDREMSDGDDDDAEEMDV
jgi:hypothetical protein